eukprot:CFRG3001T1
MSVFCAISNEVPIQPVFNKVSGHVYERQLIEKYIAEHGTDPATGTACTVDDLVDMKVNTPLRPKPASYASIPALVKSMQDEWDALMLETYTLKQDLHTTRQELTHTLYQHDAACRVIARLTKERDQARLALQSVSVAAITQANSQDQPDAMAVDEVAEAQNDTAGLPQGILEKITSTAAELGGKRRKRKKPAELASTGNINSYTQKSSHTGMHSASAKGVTCMSLHPTKTNMILTGGMDKKVVLYDRDADKVVHSFTGHSKKVTDVSLHPTQDTAVSSSADSTVKIWSTSGGDNANTLTCHKKAVNQICIHPAGDVVVSGSSDGYWAISDISTATTFSKYSVPNNSEVLAARVHPDGLLVGTGSKDSMIHIWDITEGKSVAEFTGHTDAVTDLTFSENGYYMASTSNDNTVRLWDLRMKKILNFKTFEYDGKIKPHSVSFDHSGTYMAVGGQDVRVYVVKQWEELCRLEDHQAAVTKVAFGPNAGYIASASMDRHVNFFGF